MLLQTDGHLDHLYLHPDHTRRGLAERLLDTAETFARDGGIKRLFSEASGLARPAFERAGYTMTHRRDFSVDGVSIHNWAMEKPLARSALRADQLRLSRQMNSIFSTR